MSKHLSRFGFTLTLDVDADHRYVVSSPPIDVGTYLIELTALAQRANEIEDAGKDIPESLIAESKALEDRAPEAYRKDQIRALLGDAYDQMVADGMPFEVAKLAAATVGIWVRFDAETAIRFWEDGGRPPRPKAADRKRKTNTSPAT